MFWNYFEVQVCKKIEYLQFYHKKYPTENYVNRKLEIMVC